MLEIKIESFLYLNKCVILSEYLFVILNFSFELIKLPVNDDNLFDLKLVLKKIFSIGCRNLLVEGGKNLTDSFLKNKLFNEFYLFKSPNKLGSIGKFNVSSQLHQLAFKYKNKSNVNSFTGKDIINIYS